MGLIMTSLLGIGGALLAKYVGVRFGWYTLHEAAGFLASVGGAVVLLIAFGIVRRALR
jgi:uncharacterized membrane protein YeaQ/YmgE (transglycosylase-associated protein family)